MATIIPDWIPSKATQGEKDTFELLKKLPDDYWVYYEPNINNKLPDFIIIAPDLGVIILEVKSWRLKDIRAADNNQITVLFKEREKSFKHPLRQALEYQWKLSDACENYPHASMLLHHEGKFKDKFIFPFCHYVVLSNITRDNIDRVEEVDYFSIFKPDNTIFRDQMLEMKDASPDRIRSILENLSYPFRLSKPLSNEQVNALRSIIHPQIIVEDHTPRSLTSPDPPLQVLDHRQENNASRIGDGHRIIYGVAGSGKTVLLIARSKILYDRNPEAKILLLCYNVTLSAFLKDALKKYPLIDVMHFDGWIRHNKIHSRSKDQTTGDFETDESLGKRLLEHLRHQKGDYRHYDAILIDEAQDFPSVWFSCILEALKDPENGDLLIVCDGNQGIRPIGSVSWKSIGIKAKGRTIHQAYDLDRNYRNTKGILKLASHFTSQNDKNDEDTICVVAVDPAYAMRKGPRPMLYRCKSHQDECRKILYIVKRLLEGKASLNGEPVTVLPQEIGILYHGILKKEKNLFNEFIAELSKICPVTWLNQFIDSRTKIFEQSLKVQTVHSSKGLQYRVILLLWSDMFAPHTPEDHEREQRLLYVALTRASFILIVTCSKKNEFIEKMVTSGDVEKVNPSPNTGIAVDNNQIL
jgi:hypothetical protein